MALFIFVDSMVLEKWNIIDQYISLVLIYDIKNHFQSTAFEYDHFLRFYWIFTMAVYSCAKTKTTQTHRIHSILLSITNTMIRWLQASKIIAYYLWDIIWLPANHITRPRLLEMVILLYFRNLVVVLHCANLKTPWYLKYQKLSIIIQR